MDKANPSFPRQSGVWWFGCSSTKGRQKRSGKPERARVNSALLHKGDGQFSDPTRSDVPPRFDPTDDEENENEGRSGNDGGFSSSFWDLFAKPFRGFFQTTE